MRNNGSVVLDGCNLFTVYCHHCCRRQVILTTAARSDRGKREASRETTSECKTDLKSGHNVVYKLDEIWETLIDSNQSQAFGTYTRLCFFKKISQVIDNSLLRLSTYIK